MTQAKKTPIERLRDLGLTPVQAELYQTLMARPMHVAIKSDDYGRVHSDLQQVAALIESTARRQSERAGSRNGAKPVDPPTCKVYRMTATSGIALLTETDKPIVQPSDNGFSVVPFLSNLRKPPFFNPDKPGQHAIVIVEDMAAYLLGDMPPIQGNATYFRETLQKIATSKESLTLVVTLGLVPAVPANMKAATVVYDYPLPSESEIRHEVETSLSVATTQGLNITLSDKDLGRVVQALTGLSLRQIQVALPQSMAKAFLEHGDVSLNVLPFLYGERERQFQMIAGGTGAQFVIPPLKFEMAGWAEFKRLVQRIVRMLEHPETAVLVPAALLFVGPPGTGKSLSWRYFAAQTLLPSIAMSMSAIAGDGRGVGSIPNAMQTIIKAAEACAPCIIFWDEILKEVDDPASAKRGGGTAEYTKAIAFFQTWIEERRKDPVKRAKPIIVFGTANVNDLHTGLPAGFLERFPLRWVSEAPDATMRAEIFGIELAGRAYDPSEFDLAQLARATDGKVGRDIRDLLDEAQRVALDHDRPLNTQIVLDTITLIERSSIQLGGDEKFWFRRVDMSPVPSVRSEAVGMPLSLLPMEE